MKKKKKEIKWYKEPEEHDYPAAVSYLSLVYEHNQAKSIVSNLKKSETVYFKAKDVFRASKLSLLGVSNSHVEKNIKKINKGKKMSPILLVRDRITTSVVIADGYHRLCAVYHFHEDALIPCKIVY
jgi:disulfide oxidoreductase YuzD